MNPYRQWIFRRLLDWASGKMDKERAELIAMAQGEVLELGSGTGANFPFYSDQLVRLWALEPETPVMALAEQTRLGLPAVQSEKINLLCADGHHLPFADDSLDSVICCLVLCTVPYPDKMMREVRRVLKPGGRLCLTGFLVEPGMVLTDAVLPLSPYREGAWVADSREPERAIGYERAVFEDWVRQAGLRLAEPVEPGHWSTPQRTGEFQDRIVLERLPL